MFDVRRSALAALAAAMAVGALSPEAQAQPAGGMPPPTGEPPAGAPAPGPAPVGTDTNFVSATGMQWEVMVDQQSACVTPCRLFLQRPSWITMRTRERSPLRLEVGHLGMVPSIVTAHDVQNGKYATGIVFTTFGGMALVIGVTFGAVGYGTDRDGFKTAGLITGGAGAAMTLGGIYLMRSALPRAYVRALDQRGLAIAPTLGGGAISGRF